MPDDTGEFMLGDIAVTVVLMESDPAAAPPGTTPDISTENWTPALIQEAKTKVADGLAWWKTTLAGVSPAMAADLNFLIDYTYADNPVSTRYEPINRRSDDFQLWIYDFLNEVGYNQTRDFSRDIRSFNDSQRRALGAHWGFTIFVVNSTNDFDEGFAMPGSFARAFAFAGGRFTVVPSGRPKQTFAHETGHMFWARDEYDGEDWLTRRGYYNIQNLNAPHTGYTQLPSIMASNTLLGQAYAEFSSAPSTLAMIGWQDSDGDGIFDVLDVPLSLTGSGRYDAIAGVYRFRGASAVRTLPNRNSSGLQNDITINVVGRAEYRVDGGAWTTAATYDLYATDLDLAIPLAGGSHSIEIRTSDPGTGVTSPVFQGTTHRPTTMQAPGISGFVFSDADTNQLLDNSETGWAGWLVQLVDAGGVPLAMQKSLEPDNYAELVSIGSVLSGVTVQSIGWNANGSVVSMAGDSSTGLRGFGAYSQSNRRYTNVFSSDALLLRIDFATPTSFVSLDAIGTTGVDYGRLEAFDANGNLLERYTTSPLDVSQVERMSIARDLPDIAYVLAKSHLGTEIAFDNLKVGPANSTTSDSAGAYHLPSLPAGTYHVQVAPPATWTGTTLPTRQTVELAEGESTGAVDFAIVGGLSGWHNASNPLDVDGNGTVTPLDALLVINDLNSFGAHALAGNGASAPPYLDTNNNGEVTPLDVLLVINYLNEGEGEGLAAGGSATNGSGNAGNGSGGNGSPNGEQTIVATSQGRRLRDFLNASDRGEWLRANRHERANSGDSSTTPSTSSSGGESRDGEGGSDWDALVLEVARQWLSTQGDDEHHHHDDEEVLELDELDHDHEHDHEHDDDHEHNHEHG